MAGAAAFRRWRRGEALPPFECLDTEPRRTPARFIALAERMLASGWRCGIHLVEPMRPPLNWNDVPRSLSFHLHSWDPHAILLMAYSLSARCEFLDAALAVTMDWLAQCGAAADAAEALAEPGGFAWYDMAVGLRAYRLAYLLDAAARLDDVDDATVAALLDSFLVHLTVLAREDFLTAHTNHGFYQALGQLAATWRYRGDARFAPHYAQAQARTRQMLRQQFFDEGTHKEHSPGYHLATLATLKNVVGSGIVEDPETSTHIAAIENNFAWFVLPNGNIAAVGDTDPWVLAPSQEPAARFDDAQVRWALSGGALGEPVPHGLKVFPEAGWLAVRTANGGAIKDDSYLLQWAGFHSRTHKHADHGTFLWYDGGQELLVDAGRYLYSEKTAPGSDEYKRGYWYGDPRRMYVESTRAHNCVEIDGEDYQRRGAKPFGSALTAWGRAGSLFWSECSFRHLRSVRHVRRLFFAPGHFLLVFDWLACGAKTAHRFDQWFHLAPEFDLVPGRGIRAVHTQSGLTLSLLPLLAETRVGAQERGVEGERIQGWFSDAAGSLVPNWAVAVHAEGPAATFATLAVLSGEAEANAARSRVNGSGRKGQFAWTDARGSHLLSFENPLLGALTANLESKKKS